MSEYRQAVKRLTKDERIVILHLEELIGDLKGVRVATVLKGQEAAIATAIEKEVMAHLMPELKAAINKEHDKIQANMQILNEQIRVYNSLHKELQRMIDEFQTNLKILGHLKALSTEGKVKLILPTEEELKGP